MLLKAAIQIDAYDQDQLLTLFKTIKRMCLFKHVTQRHNCPINAKNVFRLQIFV
jgi:hypothetical protein